MSSFLFRTIAIAILVAGHSMVRAEETCDYLQVLRNIIEPIQQRPFFEPADLDRIEQWYLNPKLSKKEASIKSFELYLARRFEFLDETQRKKVLTAYHQQYFYENTERLNPGYDPVQKNVVVRFPAKFRNTSVNYFLDAHELEHFIQGMILDEKGMKMIAKRDRHLSDYLTKNARQELGAMIAEWNHIRGIPRSERYRMIDEIKKSSLPHQDQDFLIRTFTHADLSLEDYLKAEWKSERHGFDEKGILPGASSSVAPSVTRKTSDREKIVVGAVATSIVSFAGCLHLKKENDTRGKYYQIVCQGIFRLR